MAAVCSQPSIVGNYKLEIRHDAGKMAEIRKFHKPDARASGGFLLGKRGNPCNWLIAKGRIFRKASASADMLVLKKLQA